ncbi:MAG: DUF2760 domain-containing protein, partial [Planctomycetales bacterium]|nr:DUF2760 domain-containing protein [Planctomycetales bacterium]
LDSFDDAQIGSAAREVMRDCRKTLDRMFAIEPLSDSEEGQSLTLVGDESPNRARISGSGSAVSGTSTTGTITHRGWQATKCEVPKWNGQEDDAWILAPVEVET